MPLYRITDEKLEAVRTTSFAEERILERKDLQRLLKKDISVLGENLMVISEEFGQWEESNRRIDLLCLDKQARLVVIEIKRTEDGGHMELQAIRYAAMVSSMTLEQAASTYAKMLIGTDSENKAEQEILEFLEIDSLEEIELNKEVRIFLVSANFSNELTTSVIWLNNYDLNIRCIRLQPYRNGDQIFIDVTQIIPLPEAADYEVKIRAQAQENKKVQTVRQEIFRRFWSQFIERSLSKTQLFANRSTTTDHWLSAGIGRSGFSLAMALSENRARIECYIRLKDGYEASKSAFKTLLSQKSIIERNFGDALDWQELPKRIGCRICKDLIGGWRTADTEWPALQDQMIETAIRLESALKPSIQSL